MNNVHPPPQYVTWVAALVRVRQVTIRDWVPQDKADMKCPIFMSVALLLYDTQLAAVNPFTFSDPNVLNNISPPPYSFISTVSSV